METARLVAARNVARWPLRVSALLLLVGALVLFGQAADAGVALRQWTQDSAAGPALLALAGVYVVLLALPFVPAIELGLAIMLTFGRDGIVLVYACTQVALVLGFACGRLLPAASLPSVGWRLPQNGANSNLLSRIGVPNPCVRWAAYASKRRYLALATALNLPGNGALGGAGGLAFLAGASRLYSFPRYCLLVAVATSPLPLLMLLCGTH